jgi:hypothetical protein
VTLDVSIVEFSATVSPRNNIQIALELMTNEQGKSCLALSILESPDVEFEVKSMIGYSTKIKDLPKLEELIVARLKAMLKARAIHPNYLVCWELPTLWADADEDISL